MRFFKSRDMRAKLAAISRSHTVVEFALDGTVLDANERFLTLMGFARDEIVGHHQSKFVPETERHSEGYRALWAKLAAGESHVAAVRRVAKDGREIWLRATYDPVLDAFGRPSRVIAVAVDITDIKRRSSDNEGQVKAINRSQAVIEFAMDGTILSANQNFLDLMGYDASELREHHHCLFVERDERNSDGYRLFWEALGRGEFCKGEYRRLAKGGRPVWISATYNPIFDSFGKPFKVVKFATDITQAMEDRLRRADVHRSLDADLGQINDAITTATMQAASAAAASVQAAANAEAATQGAENLVESIGEIAARAAEASRIAAAAVEQSRRTNDIVAGLTAAADRIGEVVSLINSIAGQTNLLALNATIEAARAGEGLRGGSRRGQIAVEPDHQRHRGDRRPDRQRAGGHRHRRAGDTGHRGDDRQDRRHFLGHRPGGGRAERRHRRHVEQHPGRQRGRRLDQPQHGRDRRGDQDRQRRRAQGEGRLAGAGGLGPTHFRGGCPAGRPCARFAYSAAVRVPAGASRSPTTSSVVRTSPKLW
jgi:methyl-accepting chemotaxis protein